MKTSKAISTISYNTREFLESKLTKLVDDGILGFWAFAFHLKEDDELSDHFHVYAEPEESIDTFQLKHEFREYISGEIKPRGTKRWDKSKWDTWYLYAYHDPDYLESLGQHRKYNYLPDIIVCSDKADMNEKIHQIDFTRFTSLGLAINCAKKGMSFDDFIFHHPCKMVHFRTLQDIWKTYYLADQIVGTVRNGRVTHTPKKRHHAYRSVKLYGFILPINFKGCKRLKKAL